MEASVIIYGKLGTLLLVIKMNKKTLKTRLSEFLDKMGEASNYSTGYYNELGNYHSFPVKDVSMYDTEDSETEM
jgi:hypothetical protein